MNAIAADLGAPGSVSAKAAVRAERRFSLLLVLACLALVVVTVIFEWQTRRTALQQAELTSRNAAAAVADHVTESVRQADMLVSMLTMALQDDRGDISARGIGDSLRESVFGHLPEQPSLHDLYVYDANGRLVASSFATNRYETSAREREFFLYHQRSTRDNLHVGQPYRTQPNGKWVIPVSRRIAGAQGRFRGVVTAALSMERLQQYLEQYALGTDGLVAVNNREGVVLARLPFKELALGMDLSSTPLQAHFARGMKGTFTEHSPVDGVQRQYSFSHSTTYPVMAVVALSVDEVLAGWRRSALLAALGLTLLLGLVGVAGWRTHRLLRSQHQLAARLAASHQRLSDLERALDEHAVVAVTDVQGRILHANDRFCALSQYSREELVGSNHRLLKSDEHPPTFYRALWRTIAQGGVWQGELCNRAKDGSTYWVDTTIVPFVDAQGRPQQYISIRTDVSERKRAEKELRTAYAHLAEVNQELARLAAFDQLTGLANRWRFDQALDDEFKRAHRSGQPLALLMIDVDHFKPFNDNYGHAAGDIGLQRVAMALRGTQRRPGDLVARWGGEEFVMLLPNTDSAGALAVAELLRRAVQALDIEHRGSPLGKVTVSVGVHALTPAQGGTPQELMEMADRALYQAKQRGRNRAKLHGPEASVSSRLGERVGQQG